jgi:cytidylate kinase
MIIAIYGRSCAGKTTVSNRVAAELKLPLRSCGHVVRDRAKALGMDVDELPDAVHRAIDEETVGWASTHQPCIVEGRFLDKVLAAVDGPVLFIELFASNIQRKNRACISGGSGITIDDLLRVDAADMRFVKRMFSSSGVFLSCVAVDTSDMTVEECVLQIRAIISAKWPRPA